MAARAIVFGPTGNVGSIVARTAQKHGAKVFLAMRDTTKSIPGLSSSEEKSGGFERIQADLTISESVSAAVKQTGATSAFMYLAHGSNDHMKATLEAAKSSGIAFLVFLSSFTITQALDKISPEDRIPWIHAQVEKNLEAVYGSNNYVALRAGAFATNTLWWKSDIHAGELLLKGPDTKVDYITPTDMGRVGGVILAEGQRDGQNIVYLYGPKMMAQREGLEIAVKAAGKRVVWDEDEHGEDSQTVLVRTGPAEKRGKWFDVAFDNHQEGVQNVEKYTGGRGTSLEEWVGENKEKFQ